MSNQTAFGIDSADGGMKLAAEFSQQVINLAFDTQNMMFSRAIAANDAALRCADAELALSRNFIADLARARSLDAVSTAWQDLGKRQIAIWQDAIGASVAAGTEATAAPSSMNAD